MKHLLSLLLVVAATFPALGATATRYITDNLSIPLRDGPSPRHKILKMVPSGTAVEFVVKDKETGYALVKVGKTEGWVPDKKLSRQTGAARQLARSKKEVEKLKAENEKLSTALAELRKGDANKGSKLSTLSSDFEQLQAKYERLKADTADVVAINAQNKALSARVDSLIAERNQLQEENKALKDKTAMDWFLRGAGVIVVGIILGLIIPRIRIRRRDSWGSGY